MNNLQEKKFDYSLVDEDTAERLKKRENELKDRVTRVVQDTTEIGKIFYEEQKNLANFADGTFVKWYKKVGFSTNFVYDAINYYKGTTFLHPKKLEKLPKYAVEAIGSDNVESEIKEKIKSGEIKTSRQLQELRKKVNQEKKQKKKLQEQIEKLKNQEPEIETIEIEKEVIPDDYNDIKEKAERLEKAQEFIKKEKEELEEQLRQAKEEKLKTKQEVDDFNKLKEQVERLRKRKDDIGEQVDSAANLSKWVMDIKKLLKNDLAPMKYSEDIIRQSHDGVVIDNVMEVVELVRQWTFDIEKMVKETKNTINLEVLK